MNEGMLNRLRQIFQDSKKSQTEIAQKTNVTSAYIWKILNKDNVAPRDLFIKTVCREFNVNEDWLRTGEGDPYIKRTRNQEIAAFMNDVMGLPDEAFKKEFIDRIRRLDEKDWEAIANIVDKLLKEG